MSPAPDFAQEHIAMKCRPRIGRLGFGRGYLFLEWQSMAVPDGHISVGARRSIGGPMQEPSESRRPLTWVLLAGVAGKSEIVCWNAGRAWPSYRGRMPRHRLCCMQISDRYGHDSDMTGTRICGHLRSLQSANPHA